MWVEHSFGTENGVQHGPEGVEAHFLSLRDGRPLTISMRGTQVGCTPYMLYAGVMVGISALSRQALHFETSARLVGHAAAILFVTRTLWD